MAIFEKRPGAPAGSIRITTDNNVYVIDDSASATITVTEQDDIQTLRSHPYVQLQGGTGGAYVPPPVYSTVYLKDGVLTDTRSGLPVSAVTRSDIMANRGAASDHVSELFFATDDNGGTLYCSNGTTWIMIAPKSVELSRQEKTDAAPTTTNSVTSPVVITGLDNCTFKYRGVNVEITLSARGVKHSVANGRTGVAILDNNNGVVANVIQPCVSSAAEQPFPMLRARPQGLVVGTTYTFKAAFFAFDAGTATFVSNIAVSPAVLSAREL